jgi:superfamily II DNA or RNA helicase
MLKRDISQLSPESVVFTNFIEVECRLPNDASLQKIGQSKIPYAVNYVNVYQDEKIVVATQYLDTARKLAVSLGSQAVVITGETPQAIRGEIQKAFANGARVLIGSSAISEGLDFSFSSRILFLESGYSFRTEQLRARCAKLGKTEPISVDILVSNHPKDKRVMDILDTKYETSYGF